MNNVWCKQEFIWLRKKPWKIIPLIFRNIGYIWQRITKGYCDKDLWNIDCWFMDLMPDMLEQFKRTKHGSPGILGTEYTDEDGILCNDECHAEWDKILEQMIFLFREMNKDTCQKKNKYKADHNRVLDEFEEKYGLFGEGLLTPEEKNDKIGRRIHFPDELPEYKDTEDNYYKEETKLMQYREQCKDQAFELFSKWFRYLWD